MQKEEAILALKELGLSTVEIKEAIRVEMLRRLADDAAKKRLQAAEIIKDMTL